MALSQSELQRASQRRPLQKAHSAAAQQKSTAFLCHSHKDTILAEGLQVWLAEQGVELYIDWKDTAMPALPNRETAARIQTQIKTCDWFLFLATGNSMSSRWCPWELGFADGTKPIDRIAIVPTSDATTTHGNEYLHLYRRVDLSAAGELLWVPPNSNQGQHIRSIPFLSRK